MGGPFVRANATTSKENPTLTETRGGWQGFDVWKPNKETIL
jgi:hypothetical protein